jgi:hypothetical protein
VVERDDRVFGTDADRHENISHNDSSGFGGNADSAETADLGRVGHRGRYVDDDRGHWATLPLHIHACSRPRPIAGAGLPGLILASSGLLGWWRRRQHKMA